MEYDFSGWVTKFNRKCTDGRTIRENAFKHCDGKYVPLVWNHDYNTISNVLGKVMLENRQEGVYGYGYFNGTQNAIDAKEALAHSDIVAMSIFATHLKQVGGDVIHGDIKEVSLVLAGANPGALIDNVIAHDGTAQEDQAYIYHGDEGDLKLKYDSSFSHAEEAEDTKEEESSEDTETIADVFNTLTEKQKNVVYAMIGEALAQQNEKSNNSSEESNEGGSNVKHNVFDEASAEFSERNEASLTHDDMQQIISEAKRAGSLKAGWENWLESTNTTLSHEDEPTTNAQAYGIKDIEWLFPEARNLNVPPDWIKRDMEWVPVVMNGVHKSPFSRIKSMFADITADEARARGYTKGKKKMEEVFSLLKRSTTPTTIYKKQKLDRDDVIDITDFDVVAWIKKEMRMMLDEEIARAILIGDGRLASSDDKINEQNIRPIWTDDILYSPKIEVTYADSMTDNQKAKQFIRQAIKARKLYKGSGNPIFFTTEDMLTELLLIEDENGRLIYESVSQLQTVLRCSRIITVPVLENAVRDDGAKKKELLGIMVNLNDYNVGADKGGAVAMFDDFDIDYNQMKYLIETRCSGALTVPKSALVFEKDVTVKADSGEVEGENP